MITAEQAAKRLGIGVTSAYRYAHAGKLPGATVMAFPGRHNKVILVDETALEKAIQEKALQEKPAT